MAGLKWRGLVNTTCKKKQSASAKYYRTLRNEVLNITAFWEAYLMVVVLMFREQMGDTRYGVCWMQVIPLVFTIWDMTAHVSQPLQRIKGFDLLSVFGLIQNFALIPQVDHPFLWKGCPDDISGKILHSFLICRVYPFTAKDIEPWMSPWQEQADQVFAILTSFNNLKKRDCRTFLARND